MTYIPAINQSASVLIVVLSKSGITSDAPNGLEWGATAPSGTGQEAAINALIASSYAAAAAAGAVGVKLVWDVACTLSGPVFLRSNMTVEAANYGCGAIMRAGADSPIFMVEGMQADMGNGAYTGAGAVATQKTFGKFDPAYSGNANPQNYRVFDPAFVNAKNIAILGGTWNGYYAGQTTQPYGTQGSLPFIVRLNIGYTSIMHFFGVDGLTLNGVRGFNGTHFGLNLCNVGNVLLEDCDIDQHMDANFGSDCFHFAGPCTNIRIINPRTHCADDNIAFNADDLASEPVEGIKCGVNWQCSGAIIGVRVTNHIIWNGRENIPGWGGICFRSSVARIDDVVVDGVSGTVGRWGIWFPILPSSQHLLVDGPGNIGTVELRNVSLDVYQPVYPCSILVSLAVECLKLTGRHRRSAQNEPDLHIDSTGSIKQLLVSDYVAYQPPGAPNALQSVVQVSGSVGVLRLDGSLLCDPSLAVSANAPLLVSGGSVGAAMIDADVEGVTNVVKLTGGSIGTVILHGAHRKAGGGSPLANGGTVTNLILGAGVFPLAYASASVPAYTGTAPININAYLESAAVVAGTTLLTFAGAAGALTGNQVLTTFNGTAILAPPAGGRDGNGNAVFDVSDALGTLSALGVQPDGLYTFYIVPGAADYRIPFRVTTPATATGYVAAFDVATSKVVVLKFQNGSYLGNEFVGISGAMPTPTTSVSIRLAGASTTLLVDGTQVAALTGQTFTANGLIGIGAKGGGFNRITYAP